MPGLGTLRRIRSEIAGETVSKVALPSPDAPVSKSLTINLHARLVSICLLLGKLLGSIYIVLPRDRGNPAGRGKASKHRFRASSKRTAKWDRKKAEKRRSGPPQLHRAILVLLSTRRQGRGGGGGGKELTPFSGRGPFIKPHRGKG